METQHQPEAHGPESLEYIDGQIVSTKWKEGNYPMPSMIVLLGVSTCLCMCSCTHNKSQQQQGKEGGKDQL